MIFSCQRILDTREIHFVFLCYWIYWILSCLLCKYRCLCLRLLGNQMLWFLCIWLDRCIHVLIFLFNRQLILSENGPKSGWRWLINGNSITLERRWGLGGRGMRGRVCVIVEGGAGGYWSVDNRDCAGIWNWNLWGGGGVIYDEAMM